jgi:hypothetical protein
VPATTSIIPSRRGYIRIKFAKPISIRKAITVKLRKPTTPARTTPQAPPGPSILVNGKYFTPDTPPDIPRDFRREPGVSWLREASTLLGNAVLWKVEPSPWPASKWQFTWRTPLLTAEASIIKLDPPPGMRQTGWAPMPAPEGGANYPHTKIVANYRFLTKGEL